MQNERKEKLELYMKNCSYLFANLILEAVSNDLTEKEFLITCAAIWEGCPLNLPEEIND